MSALLSIDNLISWLVQVSVLVVAGVALPTLLRVRHPKSQLSYYHGLLVLCFALPFIQPWQHPLLILSGSIAGFAPAAAAPRFSWFAVIAGVFVLGVFARLCWLALGLWQLRRYRRSAIPLFPMPDSIYQARKQTGADALFCISKDVSGPATLGYVDPVVLLPPAFLSLEEDAQRSVACHELLHVRRNDWLITVIEEIASALLWFHPAVWLLLAKTRLTREQVVDAEVVRMTAPAPYIEALLSMAVVAKPHFALPAAPFFTEGHLVHRMRALLGNSRRSVLRLCVSYLSAAGLLGLAGWAVLILFPLNGEAHVVWPVGQWSPAIAEVVEPRIARLEEAKVRSEEQTFTVPLPAPSERKRDVFYFIAAQPAGVVGGFVAPPPPFMPPPMPGTGIHLAPPVQIRFALRAGQRATPEEVQQFVDSFPVRSLVEVTQTPDGVVQKVMVSRRPSDETTSIPARPGAFFGLVGPNAAGTAIVTTEPAATDIVH